MSEELIGLGAYSLFATHFTALSQLAELYPNAQLWHFTVESSAQVGIPGCPLSSPNLVVIQPLSTEAEADSKSMKLEWSHLSSARCPSKELSRVTGARCTILLEQR